MAIVIRRCGTVLDQLSNYRPTDDDEAINVETAQELFSELLDKARRRQRSPR